MTIEQKIQELLDQKHQFEACIKIVDQKLSLLEEINTETAQVPTRTSNVLITAPNAPQAPSEKQREARELLQQLAPKKELTSVAPGKWNGKKATIITEFIGNKDDKKNYYSGDDSPIS